MVGPLPVAAISVAKHSAAAPQLGSRQLQKKLTATRSTATVCKRLAQRMTGEFLPHQDPAQVRVVLEPDAVHVVDLALAPFRARPDVGDGIDLQRRIFSL